MGFIIRFNILLMCLLLCLLLFVTIYHFSFQCNCEGSNRSPHDNEPPFTNVDVIRTALQVALDDLLYRTHKTDNTNKLSPTIDEEDSHIPTIFTITPTHKRWTQKADLTRFCQTLMHVKNIKWIVVEDHKSKSSLVSNFLKYCKVSSVHLLQKSSSNFTNTIVPKKDDPSKYYLIQKPRGIEQRNMGLQWLREHYSIGTITGVVYFADDDNTYDLRIFEEMRYTKKVSIWPVGIVGGLKYEGPKCSRDKVTGWYSYWATDRKFRIDFAGFAVNVDLILKSNVMIKINSKPGYVEDEFLQQLVEINDLEAKAGNCRKVYVWHTRTENPSMIYENQLIEMGYPSSKDIEV